MVSLENKYTYLERIKGIPKLKAFYDLLLEKSIFFSNKDSFSETDELFFGIITAIQTNDKEAFERLYLKKSKSNPRKESPAPFVNDDFLIFSLIFGIRKFNLDKSWIRNIISIRNRNSITITLENILNDNFLSTANLSEIVLMYLQLNNQDFITNNLLNTTYKSINENTNLFESKSDFHILCTVRAYDLIVMLKEAPDDSEISQLRKFNSNFINRTKMLSKVLQIIIFVGFIWAVLRLPVYSPKAKEFIDDNGYAFTIFGTLGLTILGNTIPFIKNKSHELIMYVFGYPKGLLIKSKKVKD